MSDDELRIEVAKAKGYERFEETDGHISWGHYREDHWFEVYPLPDWPNDISAAYDLEESVPIPCQPDYVTVLGDIVGGKTIADYDWNLVHATPEQRTRAWKIYDEERKEK